MRQRRAGFSLLEVMTVMTVIMIGATVAVIQMRQSMAMLDADKAASTVTGQLRYARQVAVDQRRNVLVEFVGTNQIRVVRQNGGGATPTVLTETTLPAGYRYARPTGMTEWPDEASVSGAVVFGSAASATFLGDGVLADSGGTVVNGTVFTIGSSNPTGRAITVNGASGRTKLYTVNGTTWLEQ
jgi:prepilin-type N-terminal cleavage/methylation domain-containing protein